jgi:hypothetical protein
MRARVGSIAVAVRIDAMRMNQMNMVRWLLIPSLFVLSACDQKNKFLSGPVDPRSIVTPPSGLQDDIDIDLYVVHGLSGLIGHGDELMVMVYGHGSREAKMRTENITAGQTSLSRWLDRGNGDQALVNGRFLRVPDLDDESGSRFYYYERGPGKTWEFKAICAGAWRNNPKWPSDCDFTYPIGNKIVSISLEEPLILRHYDAIVERVIAALKERGVIARNP